jgi:hypothetical protein
VTDASAIFILSFASFKTSSNILWCPMSSGTTRYLQETIDGRPRVYPGGLGLLPLDRRGIGRRARFGAPIRSKARLTRSPKTRRKTWLSRS